MQGTSILGICDDLDICSLPPQLAREVLDIAASHIQPGVTTDEIDAVVHSAIIERNAYPSPLNYRNFPKSVCTYVWVLRFLPALFVTVKRTDLTWV